MKYTQQELLMAQNCINNILNYFINNNYLTKQQALNKLSHLDKNLTKDFVFKKNSNLFDVNKKFYSTIEIIRQLIVDKTGLSPIETENKINAFLGLFTPNQADIDKILLKREDPLMYLRKLSLLNYYVKCDKNKKNLKWIYNTSYGNLKITINKAKPEKTVEQIRLEKENKTFDKNKPKCPICIENIGWCGTPTNDSRENLRVYKMRINNDNWFFQYSPYEYVDNHFVLNNLEHKPMAITKNTVIDLISFVDLYPRMFLGSNADLPIVGGSLLSHNHYQGGTETLPVMNAKTLKKIKVSNTSIHILNWPLNCVKLVSQNRDEIIDIGNYLIREWRMYDKKDLINQNNNTSTLIVKKDKTNYNLFIIFRNNSTSEDRPTGWFHVNPKRFNIKQENIGLMEAAGLAILPKRLESEMDLILEWLKSGKKQIPDQIKKHEVWINEIISKNKKVTKEILFKNISETFKKGLEDCRVLKTNKFIKYITGLFNDEIVLKNKNTKVTILKQGHVIKQICHGKNQYLLEYKDKASYYNNSILLNAFVGPVAGRIQDGIIVFKNKQIHLPTNEEGNHIHSMDFNTAFVNFEFSKIKKTKKSVFIDAHKTVWNDDIKALYTFKIRTIVNNDGSIEFEYNIGADNDFICNPTQHFYFRFNNDNILDYKINIDNTFDVWLLNKKCNPRVKQKIINKNQFVSIKKLAEEFKQTDSKIINGYIDHPFVNNSEKDIIVKSNSAAIQLSSLINDFVIYTHNWPNDKKLKSINGIKPNQGLCVEFQKIPTSLANKNYDEICYDKKNIYKNIIRIDFK